MTLRAKMIGIVLSLGLGAMSGSALASTTISSYPNPPFTISASTTWNLAGSPYILDCDVLVTSGATLTIDAGVEVRFKANKTLTVNNGTITAIGAIPVASHIRFISDAVATPGNGVTIQNAYGQFRYCDFNNLNTAINLGCCGGPNPPANIDFCTFGQNTTALGGYTGQPAIVNSSTFTGNSYGATGADKNFTGCTFTGNIYGIGPGVERTNVTSCTFSNNTTGLNGRGGTVQSCLVNNNTTGIVQSVEGWTLRHNDISANQTGLVISSSNGFISPIECNDIYGNDIRDADMQTAYTVSIPNNWWGTTNPTLIDAAVRDGFDVAGQGYLLYNPVLPGLQATTGTCNCTTPVFNVHPATQTKRDGATATFTASATATGTPTYRWRRNGVNLNDGGRYSGVTTTTLTVSPLAYPGSDPNWTDGGIYDCVATNLCGTATSNPATLTVFPCAADINHNGTLTVSDIFQMLTAWFSGCP